MIPKGIIDKYEVISVLYENAATTVLLVKHRQIGDTRVLKAIQASQPGATRILSEANLLAGLKSPGIPTIFDVGQTEDFNYLVEEFIEGQSLNEFILDNKSIKIEQVLEVLVQTCKILEQMHTGYRDPVLYLDMKPEHIIQTKDGIKLIDFGIAERKSKCVGINAFTPKFAAPEQIRGEQLDEKCDVYGIGKVIEFCIPYIESKEVYKLKNIAKIATDPVKENRYNNVEELKKELEKLLGQTSYENLNKKKNLNKKIAVIGAQKNCGCTHIAINLCTYLNHEGMDCYYSTYGKEFIVRRLYENIKDAKLKGGVLYHKSFKGLMEYGPCVEEIQPPNGNQIVDCGFLEEKDVTADEIIYVISFSPWMERNFPEWIKDENVTIICNNASKLQCLKLAKQLKKKVFRYPEDSHSFNISKNEKRILHALLKENGLINV